MDGYGIGEVVRRVELDDLVVALEEAKCEGEEVTPEDSLEDQAGSDEEEGLS